MLYSGKIGGIDSNAIIEGMLAQGEDIRVINKTPAAVFLDSAEYKFAVARAYGVSLDEVKTPCTAANQFLFAPKDGVWAEASSRFFAGASGDVRTLTAFADGGCTFALVELPKLLSDTAVTSINGVPKDVYQAILDKTGSLVEVNKAVSASSLALVSDMNLAKTGELITKVDSTSLFKGTNYTGTSLPVGEVDITVKSAINQTLTGEAATNLGEGWRNLSVGAKAVALAEGVSKGLGLIGIAVTAYQIDDMVTKANDAYAAGDPNKASKILADGSVLIAGGWAGGIAASSFAADFFAPLLPTGPVGDVAYIVLVAASGIGGAIFGEAAIKSLLGAVGTGSNTITGDVWKTTTYGNGVKVEIGVLPYNDPTFEPGAIRVGAQFIPYTVKVTTPNGSGGEIIQYVGKTGVVTEVNGQIVRYDAISISDVGAKLTQSINGTGQIISSTTQQTYDDGTQLVTVTYASELQTVISTATDNTSNQVDYPVPGNLNTKEVTNRDAAGNITDKTTVAAALDAKSVAIPNSYLTTTTTIAGDTSGLNGTFTQVDRSFDAQGNLTTTVDSKVGDNDVSVTYSYDANKTPVVQSLNSINGPAVDVATSDAFVLQANAEQNTNTSTQDPVTLTQSLSQAILPTLNVNVNNADTAASTTGPLETVTLTDGSSVTLTSGNQYVSTTTAPPTDSAIAIELPVVLTTPPTTVSPSTITINGVIVTDNGDGTYEYSLATDAGGSQTISENGNGAAVVNVYTAGGAFAGSQIARFDSDSCRRYKVRSCLRPYLLDCRHKTYLKTAKNCSKSTSARAQKLKTAQKLADLDIKSGYSNEYMRKQLLNK